MIIILGCRGNMWGTATSSSAPLFVMWAELGEIFTSCVKYYLYCNMCYYQYKIHLNTCLLPKTILNFMLQLIQLLAWIPECPVRILPLRFTWLFLSDLRLWMFVSGSLSHSSEFMTKSGQHWLTERRVGLVWRLQIKASVHSILGGSATSIQSNMSAS